MADHLQELPLFPLHTVLLPYAHVQLHVFEERYREMMRHCEEFDSHFGVVLIRSGEEVGGEAEPFLVGTAAHIQKIHRYHDGRLHVEAQGQWRFRIRKLLDDGPYSIGLVNVLTEGDYEEQVNRVNALASRAKETFRVLVEGMLARPDFNIDVQLPDDPMKLSFVIAQFLQLDKATNQRLLELTDTAERLMILNPLIEQQIMEAKTVQLTKLSTEHLQDWITPN